MTRPLATPLQPNPDRQLHLQRCLQRLADAQHRMQQLRAMPCTQALIGHDGPRLPR